MSEAEKKLTPEDELLKAASGGSVVSDASEGDDESQLSDEQKLIADLKEKNRIAEDRASKAEEDRDAARAQKDNFKREATTAAERNIIAQEDAFKSKLNAAKSSFESAQKEWDDAYDAGDKTKLRLAQEKLNDAQMGLRRAEFNDSRFKEWKEGQGKTATGGEELYDLKTGAGDILRVPRSAVDWAKKHPKLADDRDFSDAVYDADGRAKRRNIEVYSPEYYKFLDSHLEKMGLTDKNDDDADTLVKEPEKKAETIKKPEKNASSTAIPSGGSTGSSSGSAKKQTFTMTTEHREAAAISFPELHRKDPKAAEEKYAKYQLEIQQKKARGELP